MLGFLIATHAIISVLLVTVVLMQASQGGGLAGSIGGQTTNTVFGGRSGATALSKMTTYLAVAFMGLALLISLLGRPSSGASGSVIEQAHEEGVFETPMETLSLPPTTLPDKENK